MLNNPYTLGRLLAVASLLMIALTPLGGTAAAADCEPCADPYARFANFESGGVSLQTQAGTQTIEVDRRAPAGLAISTTGVVSFDVEYQCTEAYHVWVVKNDADSPATVYDSGWVATGCGSGVDTHQVEIGLDAGDYEFFLEAYSCAATKHKDYRHMVVVDPPLPLIG